MYLHLICATPSCVQDYGNSSFLCCATVETLALTFSRFVVYMEFFENYKDCTAYEISQKGLIFHKKRMEILHDLQHSFKKVEQQLLLLQPLLFLGGEIMPTTLTP